MAPLVPKWLPLFVLLASLCPVAAAAQKSRGADRATEQPPSLPAGGPFADGAWNVQLLAGFFLEAWNKNLSSEELYGAGFGVGWYLRRRSSLNLEAAVLRVGQTLTDDALVSSVSGIVRWQPYQDEKLSLFLEAGPGVSYASTVVPFRGTRFNFLMQAGGGGTYKLSDRAHLLAGLRWVHLSNNSLAGRDRNPDIQAVGGYAGLLLPF